MHARATLDALLFHAVRAACGITPELPGKHRLRTFLTRLGDHVDIPQRVEVRTREGLRLCLDTTDFLQREIYMLGSWEPPVGQVLRHFLRPGDVFVDVGANVGYHTLHAARLVGAAGRVLAFEPNEKTRQDLTANIALNGFTNIQVFPTAIGNHKGTVEFFPDTGRNSGAASIVPGRENTGMVAVGMDTLDNVLAEGAVHAVAVLKLDIEGAELQALEGAAGLFSGPNTPVVVCEVSEYSLSRLGASAEDVFSLMERHGYTSTVISPVRVSVFSTAARTYKQYDVLFEPRR